MGYQLSQEKVDETIRAIGTLMNKLDGASGIVCAILSGDGCVYAHLNGPGAVRSGLIYELRAMQNEISSDEETEWDIDAD